MKGISFSTKESDYIRTKLREISQKDYDFFKTSDLEYNRRLNSLYENCELNKLISFLYSANKGFLEDEEFTLRDLVYESANDRLL